MAKKVVIKDVVYVDKISGCNKWLYGFDYGQGDFIDYEEEYLKNSERKSNRLVFISTQNGDVIEPISMQENEFLGKPVYYQGNIYVISVNYMRKEVTLYKASETLLEVCVLDTFSCEYLEDYLNLGLYTKPLIVASNSVWSGKLQIIWPYRLDVELEEKESLNIFDNDIIISECCYGEKDEWKDVIIRDIKTGIIKERIKGFCYRTVLEKKWLICNDFLERRNYKNKQSLNSNLGQFHIIKLEGVQWLYQLENSDEWYYGYEEYDDYIRNRLFLINEKDDRIVEPIKTKKGEYILCNPKYCDGNIYILVKDYNVKETILYKCYDNLENVEVVAKIPFKDDMEIEYIILFIDKQVNVAVIKNSVFYMLWPEAYSFQLSDFEDVVCYKDKVLVCELEENYKIGTVFRDIKSGKIIEKFEGVVVFFDNY